MATRAPGIAYTNSPLCCNDQVGHGRLQALSRRQAAQRQQQVLAGVAAARQHHETAAAAASNRHSAAAGAAGVARRIVVAQAQALEAALQAMQVHNSSKP